MKRGMPAKVSRGAVLLLLAGCSTDETATTFSREALLKPETCRECHENHYVEWSGSMHAYASMDPVFVAMNARGQRETNGELGNFCVKCHAPMAVNEGATQDGLNLTELPSELQGITCYFCHNAASVNGTHGNPIDLSNDTMLRGNFKDPVANSAHDAEYSSLLDGNDVAQSSRLCGSCHDIVIPRDLNKGPIDVPLERTFQEWDESIFSVGPLGRLSCARCHMGSEPAVPVSTAPGSKTRPNRHTHEFPAVDVALTPFPEMESQRAAVERLLDTALRVKVCATPRAVFTIDLDNLGAGHNLPSGASQDRRLWVEVRVFETPGDAAPVYEAGVAPASGDVDEIGDRDDAWILRDRAFDAKNEEAHMFWNVASVEPGTLLAPVTLDPLDTARYHREIITKRYRWRPLLGQGKYPGRIAVTVKMTPVAKAVLNDLVTSGDLKAADAAQIPTFTILPNRSRGDTATVEWTYEDSLPGGNEADRRCVQTGTGRD